MKKLLFLFFMIPLIGFGQVQNSKLAQNLLLSVQSGANSLPGANINGDPTLIGNSWWTAQSGWTIASGTATHSGADTWFRRLSAMTVGETYNISFTIVSTDGNVYFADDNTNWIISATTGNKSITFKATGTTIYFQSAATCVISNIVIRKINTTALTLPDPSYSMTNTGAIPTFGHKGNSSYLSFDGVDDKMSIPDDPKYDFDGTPFSIVVRIKLPSALITSENYILEKGTNSFFLNLDASRNFFRWGKRGVAYWSSGDVSATPYLGQVITVIVGWDGTNSFMYINEVEKYNAIQSTNLIAATGSAQSIGWDGVSSGYLKADIYSIRFFNYALDATARTYYSNPANHLKAGDSDGSGNQNLLDLTAESFISPTLIRDWYHSTDIALTGTTAPRLVKQGNLSGWRFDGSTSYLSKTGASDGLTGDITLSAWIFPVGWGENDAGQIFFNEQIYFYTSATGSYVRFRRDASTTVNSGTISLNTWNHVCVTSNSAGYSTIYINGVISGTPGSAGTPVSGTTYFVGNHSNLALTFNGCIEGLTISKGIWSQEQISLAYSSYQE